MFKLKNTLFKHVMACIASLPPALAIPTVTIAAQTWVRVHATFTLHEYCITRQIKLALLSFSKNKSQ